MVASDSFAQRRVGSIVCRKWHLESLLHTGKNASVYLATLCGRRSQRVAVRLLHPEFATDESIRTRFFRDGYLANQVAHPACVSVLGHASTEDGTPCLIMELLQGESLECLLRRRSEAMSLRSALGLVDQLLDVLRCAHDRRIVHRNLSPHHLFVTNAGQLKVLDFGGARLLEVISGSGRPGSHPGTPGYAPPEQVCGRADPTDPGCDIYAAGAILYSTICGRRVHDAETPMEQIARTISLPAPSIASVAPLPPAIVELVDRALCYDRRSRWRDVTTMQRALRRAARQAAPSEALWSALSRSISSKSMGSRPLGQALLGSELRPSLR